MCEHIAQEDHLHVFPGIGQRLLTGSEKHQDGIEEDECDGGEEQSDDDVYGCVYDVFRRIAFGSVR